MLILFSPKSIESVILNCFLVMSLIGQSEARFSYWTCKLIFLLIQREALRCSSFGDSWLKSLCQTGEAAAGKETLSTIILATNGPRTPTFDSWKKKYSFRINILIECSDQNIRLIACLWTCVVIGLTIQSLQHRKTFFLLSEALLHYPLLELLRVFSFFP